MASEPEGGTQSPPDPAPSKPKPPPEPALLVGLRKVDKAIGVLEAAVIVVFLAALIGVGAFQAISRNFFSKNPEWVDPIIRSSVFLIGMVGASMAAQSDRLINIDILSRWMPGRGKLVVKLITAAFAIYVCWWFIQSGILVQKSMIGEADDAILKARHVSLAMPVCAGLIAGHIGLHALIDLYYLVTGKEAPQSEDEGLRL